ncbi:hypothetical protein CLV47_10858 [Antricoccus suffuscus]|uniref:Uncharacterized protein n=1 Tax=Antricoccus suffuscus TaxID=1629062 RepID=A0A2T0ZZB3_9ACTN|nr:hypothetical protein CLV47_10858 [Antricoccus suffuscus]
MMVRKHHWESSTEYPGHANWALNRRPTIDSVSESTSPDPGNATTPRQFS